MEGKAVKTTSYKDEIRQYVALAITGHYPFLESNWLKECNRSKTPLTFKNASKNVQEVFQRMHKLRTFEHKLLALHNMDEDDRNRFVKSFLKVVEHNVLERTKTLQ